MYVSDIHDREARMKDNGERWKALDIRDPGVDVREVYSIKNRVFCVKCGRISFITTYDGAKYQCLGGHWMTYASDDTPEPTTAPMSWAQASVVDPGLKFPEVDGVFCTKCGRQMFQHGDKIRFECPVGHMIDFKNYTKQ
jgi:ribosomal protein S27AE